MDTKRLITQLSIFAALFGVWLLARNIIQSKHPEWFVKTPAPVVAPATPAVAPPAVPMPTPTTAVAVTPTTVATTVPAVAAAVPPGPAPAPAAPTGTTVIAADTDVPTLIGSLTTRDPNYTMGLAIDAHGAGISSVTLNDFFENADQKEPFVYEKPIERNEEATRPLAVRSIKFASGEIVPLGDLNWKRTSVTVDSATYSVTIGYAGKPVLVINRTYTVPARKSPGDGFDVAVTQTFNNVSAAPIIVSEVFNGPTIPARENERSEDRRYVTGYDKGFGKGFKEVEIVHTFVGDLGKDKPAKELVVNDQDPLLWFGSASSYFDAIVKPDAAGVDANALVKIASVSAVGLPVDPNLLANASAEEKKKPYLDDPTSLTITTGDFTIPPGATVPFNTHAFFGPKQRQLLSDTPYYADYPRGYDLTLVYVSKYCAFVTFGWLINTLYAILWFFDKIVRDWGLSIIGLVCLVRLLLHPITKKTQINMVRMSKMAPEMERLKKKYGDNKEEFAKAQMALYREQGLGGFLGCLPMFLQTPIWLALWNALQSTFELRQAPFMRWGGVHLTWITDLSKPDALFNFPHVFHLPLVGDVSSFNLLPLLMAVVTYLQQAMTPAPATMTPEQKQQRNMMKYMSLIVPVFLYNGPSGLTLYILTSSTIGIIEQKIVRDHIKKKEEAEKAGLVLVDDQPVRAKKGRGGIVIPPKKQGWIATKIAQVSAAFAEQLAKAEQMKREADRKK